MASSRVWHVAAVLLFATASARGHSSGPRHDGGGPTPRVVVFKVSRTGSTWLADMLKGSPNVAFFKGEAQGCCKELADRALYSILAAPTCKMNCKMNCRKSTGWIDATPSDADRACLADKLVGFSLNPWELIKDGGDLTWADWPRYLRLPHVTTVVYLRTNQVKHAVSRLHAQVLVNLCGTHKTISEHDQRCAEKHRAEINNRTTVEPETLSKHARNVGSRWLELLEHATAAAGGPVFLLFYEALQADARRELDRLFAHVGLPPAAAKASSGSVKITSDDLREALVDYAGARHFFKKHDPALLPQLEDRHFTVFRTLHLAGGNWTSLDAFSASD